MSGVSDPPFSLFSPHSPTIPLLSPPAGSSQWSPLDVLRSYCIRGVPGWSSLAPSHIRLTQLKKGMTNQLFVAERVEGEEEAGGGMAKVVVRVFGADTSTFFDREYEEYITRRLSKRGVGSRILTEFGSGRIECFLEGRTLDCDDLSDPRISFLAAKALATLHSKHIPITASLIDSAKKKVQRDAAKLLPLEAAGAAAREGGGPRKATNGSPAMEGGASTSPPSSPSLSFSSVSPSASASQPASPALAPVEAQAALPPLVAPPPASSAAEAADGALDSVGYQEPLLYFRIHHWYNVARRLHFGGEEEGQGLAESLDSFRLSAPPAAGPASAASKRRLFLSLDLQSPRVEAEERWLIGHLRSLHSPIVFCHNDLQEGNLILEEKQPRDRRRRRQRQPPSDSPLAPAATNGSHHPPLPSSSPPPSSQSQIREVAQDEDVSGAAAQRLTAPRLRALSSPGVGPFSSLVIDVTAGHRAAAPSAIQALQHFAPVAPRSISPSISYDELLRLMHSPHSPQSPEQRPGPPAPLPSPASPRSPFPSSSSPPYSGWRLHMIDFEYSSYNPRGFDLGNHLCEHYIDYSHSDWPGFVIKPQQFPSDHHIRRFLRVYLDHYRRLTRSPLGAVTEADVDAAMEEALWFTLASHFKWAMWAVVQAARSEIHFGYMEYAVQRMAEYYRWKDALTQRFATQRQP